MRVRPYLSMHSERKRERERETRAHTRARKHRRTGSVVTGAEPGTEPAATSGLDSVACTADAIVWGDQRRLVACEVSW